jgi:hypothetical protein
LGDSDRKALYLKTTPNVEVSEDLLKIKIDLIGEELFWV